MRTSTPSEAAIEYVNAYNSHDPERLRRGYHPDFAVSNPIWEGTRNAEETVEFISHVWETLPGSRFEPVNLVVDGDTAVLEFMVAWDDPRDGTTKRTPVADVFTVRDGLLYNLRAYMDATTFHQWMDDMASRTTRSDGPAID